MTYQLPKERYHASNRQAQGVARNYDTSRVHRSSVADEPKLTQQQVWATEIAFYLSAIIMMVIFTLDHFLG